MSVALVFPGQGSQSVGMLAALAARYDSVGRCFEEASNALGFDLWRLVSHGPADQLNATEYTQPALLTAGVATWRVWREVGGMLPVAVAGHSLGEFTALVCAQTLEFAAALQLVRYRGQIMQQAVADGEGAMAAILGIDDAEVEAACAESRTDGVVEAVNFNSPGQVVIAGQRAAVQRAIEAAKQRGAKRAVLLPVSVPAHSSLMQSAAQRLSARLGQLTLHAPTLRFISSVDGREHTEPADIRATLVRQLASPVRWSDTVRALLAIAPILIECGPGKVLTSLNRRIERGAQCWALEDPDSINAALAATQPTAGTGATHA